MDIVGKSLNTDVILNRLQVNPLKKTEDAQTPENSTNLLGDFGHMLRNQLDKINNLQVDAEKAVQTYAVGGQIELHDVVAATDKAEMSLQLALQVRNKMLQAYQEISRMSI